MITELRPNEIFVFGANEAGRHGKGAALTARQKFGAVYGVGEGRTGQCYAFPTLDGNLRKRTFAQLRASRDLFFRYAGSHPELQFLMTRVGCGLAGYPESDMKNLFSGAPANVVLPPEWI